MMSFRIFCANWREDAPGRKPLNRTRMVVLLEFYDANVPAARASQPRVADYANADHAALLVKITPLVKFSAAGLASRKKTNLQADGSNLC
jgi:hypothetical protein